MCCQSVLILTHLSKVHSQIGSHYKLSPMSDCISLSVISVLCNCQLLVYGPEALHPPFVSSHPLCSWPFHQPSAPSLTGEWSLRLK